MSTLSEQICAALLTLNVHGDDALTVEGILITLRSPDLAAQINAEFEEPSK